MYKRYTLIILVIYFFYRTVVPVSKILNLFECYFFSHILLFFEATFCTFIHTDYGGKVMLNVLIIDDDLKDSKDLEKLCIHYFNKRNID